MVHTVRLTTFVALVFSSSALCADLLTIFRYAQGSDPVYAAARATWAATQERIPQARAGLLPLVSISASAQHNDRNTRVGERGTPEVSESFGSANATLSVSQPIYRRQNTVAYEQALTQAEQADAQLALAAQDLILRVAQAYLDVLPARDNVALAQAQRTAIGRQLEQARRNFEVGNATITDTHEAQARYDLTIAQEIIARNELELKQRALEQLIGRVVPELAPLGGRFELLAPAPAAMEPWVRLAYGGNLQVKIAQSGLAFAAQEIDRNRAGAQPTIDAFGTLGGSRSDARVNTGGGVDTRSAVFGVQIALPIYQGGLIRSRVREAIANEDRARNELQTAQRAAEFDARQAFLGVTSGTAQIRALEQAIVSTESQLSSTRLGQEIGVRTLVDVLNAQQLLFSARRDLAQSKYGYMLSLLRLEAAIGELTETDLASINRWLDPSAAAAP